MTNLEVNKMFKKKILSLILIALIAISSIGMCSAMKIKFDNRNDGMSPRSYDNEVTLYQNNSIIYHNIKHSSAGSDKTFDISNDIIKRSTYWEISAVGQHNEHVSHHITVSDDFKTNIVGKMTFLLTTKFSSTGGYYYTTMTFMCHSVSAAPNCYYYVGWTLRRLD